MDMDFDKVRDVTSKIHIDTSAAKEDMGKSTNYV